MRCVSPLFGREHYHAVLLAQIAIDIAGCFVIADLARRTVSVRASQWVFALAALCPFTANYTVAPLAETLSIFFTAVALDAAVAGFMHLEDGVTSWKAWICCGLAVSAGIQLRPDGGILLAAIGLFLLWRMWQQPTQRAQLFWVGVLVLVISIAPLVPWTVRNWREFHQFEPLAPRYASDPDEFVPSGFDRWVRTWMVDYVSTEEIYWQVPGSDVDPSLLPSRAFDNQQEREQTQAIFDDYAKSHFVGPELNERFAQLAQTAYSATSLALLRRGCPRLRIADMWLRPRTEMLPLNSRWWEYADDTQDCVLATLWGAAESVVSRGGRHGIDSRPTAALSRHDAAVRLATFGVSGNSGEPRASLHAGVLSDCAAARRSVDFRLEALAADPRV